MTPIVPLTGSHLRTYNTIFQHPVSHNLAWHDVHALFRHLGRVDEEPNGNLKVTRHGESMILHAPRAKEVGEADEILALRRFLERTTQRPAASQETVADWLVIIDHREARIFRSAAPGSVAQQIRPPVPVDFTRSSPRAKEFSRGPEKPDPSGFFEPVAAVLNGAGNILLFGGGSGKASEMEQFVAWLKTHRPELTKRIVGTLTIDEHHQTEGQILATAREFYLRHRTPSP